MKKRISILYYVKAAWRKAGLWLAIPVFLLHFGSLRAQVTIGGEKQPEPFSILEIVSQGKNGGLRLPQLNKVQKTDLTAVLTALGPATAVTANGLVILNKENNCVEYWKEDQWISLCEGASRITIEPEPFGITIDANGRIEDEDGDELDYLRADDPDAPDGPFNFVVMLGNEYASIFDEDENDGYFGLSFLVNNSTHKRSAIVRVTNTSTGKYLDVLFTQDGIDCASLQTVEAPLIKTTPSSTIGANRNIAFCAGGAVYLSIDTTAVTNGFNMSKLDELIWARNGVEIARGVTHITATQAGEYDVYMGIVGCNAKTGNAVTVTRNGDASAPMSVTILITGNNGTVCDETGTMPYGVVKLTARKVNGADGTVRWFKNGELQTAANLQGDTIRAGIGSWFAVVNDGTCYSTPSEKVEVTLDPYAGANLPVPEMDLGTGDFCAGSTRTFSVNNADNGITYVWYANNTQIGVGSKIQYVVPTGISQIIIRCRATKPNSCAAEASDDREIFVRPIPAMPSIGGDARLCNGKATLSILPAVSGTYTYAWYKDGELKASTQLYTIKEGGDYYATVTGSGCTSPMAHINIPKASSAPPVVKINASATNTNRVLAGSQLTFTADVAPGPATDYIWSVTNANIKVGGQQGDAFAVVEFPSAAPVATVSVEGFNACGSLEAKIDLEVTNACETIDKVVFTDGKLAQSVLVGSSTTLKVAATFTGGNTAPRTYQWHMNGNPISGETSDTYVTANTTTGTNSYYCVVSGVDGCSANTLTSATYMITANAIPTPGENIGSSTFSGRVCFDIDYSSNGAACGTVDMRQTSRASFNLRTPQDLSATAPYSGVQIYTFTAGASVSNIRFLYNDISGHAIDSIVPVNANDATSNFSAKQTSKVTVYFKPSLNTYLQGKTSENALHPELFVQFNDMHGGNGQERSIKLRMNLQDCSCCGARTVGGGWQTFQCQNRGADPDLSYLDFIDPPGSDGGKGSTLGWLYQWGRSEDGFGDQGYQRRNSNTRALKGVTEASEQAKHPNHADFITCNNANWYYDWMLTRYDVKDRWGDGTQKADLPKGSYDPCPDGWKVPTYQQMLSIWGGKSGTNSSAAGNTWVWTGNGYKVGSDLYFPAAGRRRVLGQLDEVGKTGYYWTSTSNPTEQQSYALVFEAGKIEVKSTVRATGASVRCIPE